MIALGGVIVDDVENDFDAGLVQAANHCAKFRDIATAAVIAMVRSKKAERIIAPVVGQPRFDEMTIVDERLHRHQLHQPLRRGARDAR